MSHDRATAAGEISRELREPAVRMTFEGERHAGSQWGAICSVAEKPGPTPETVRATLECVD